MKYMHIVKDFAERTKHNLKLIEEHRLRGEKAYEVTQLINSCLGLLVLPQQRYINSIPNTPIEELEAEGWVIPKVVGDFPQVENLNKLFRYLRNAIAHFNIEFICDSTDEIISLKVWNAYQGRRIWEAVLGLNELKSLLEKFTDMLVEYK